jgi:hypothetical protein
VRRETVAANPGPKRATFRLDEVLSDGVVTLRKPASNDVDHLARWGNDPALLERNVDR